MQKFAIRERERTADFANRADKLQDIIWRICVGERPTDNSLFEWQKIQAHLKLLRRKLGKKS